MYAPSASIGPNMGLGQRISEKVLVWLRKQKDMTPALREATTSALATTDEENKWNSGLISLMKAAEFMKRRDGFPAPDDGPFDEEDMTACGKSLSDFCYATKAAFTSAHKPPAPGSKLAWTQRHAKTSEIYHVYDKDIAQINLAAQAACPQDGDGTTIPATLMTSLLMQMMSEGANSLRCNSLSPNKKRPHRQQDAERHLATYTIRSKRRAAGTNHHRSQPADGEQQREAETELTEPRSDETPEGGSGISDGWGTQW